MDKSGLAIGGPSPSLQSGLGMFPDTLMGLQDTLRPKAGTHVDVTPQQEMTLIDNPSQITDLLVEPLDSDQKTLGAAG